MVDLGLPATKVMDQDKGNFFNPPKKKPQSLRKKSGRKSGGQKGHPGSTLEKVAVQYGPRVKAAALYLGSYQLVPDERLSELFGELFNCPLSQGTLANIVKRGSQQAATAMEPIREALIVSPVVHVDETGCTLHGERHWLHDFGTESLTQLMETPLKPGLSLAQGT